MNTAVDVPEYYGNTGDAYLACAYYSVFCLAAPIAPVTLLETFTVGHYFVAALALASLSLQSLRKLLSMVYFHSGKSPDEVERRKLLMPLAVSLIVAGAQIALYGLYMHALEPLVAPRRALTVAAAVALSGVALIATLECTNRWKR